MKVSRVLCVNLYLQLSSPLAVIITSDGKDLVDNVSIYIRFSTAFPADIAATQQLRARLVDTLPVGSNLVVRYTLLPLPSPGLKLTAVAGCS